MQLEIDFTSIDLIFSKARDQGRDFLFEYEVYELLARSGSETPPKIRLIERGDRCSDDELVSMPGEKTVLKIVSPYIIHKTEAGGVRVVDKEPNKIRSAVRRMFYEVPENYAKGLALAQEGMPVHYRGLTGEALTAAIARISKGYSRCSSCPRIQVLLATN